MLYPIQSIGSTILVVQLNTLFQLDHGWHIITQAFILQSTILDPALHKSQNSLAEQVLTAFW